MNLKLYLNHIFQNNMKVVVLMFLLLEPSAEIVYYLQCLDMGAFLYRPDYVFFLANNSVGVGHIFQSIFIWFLPLYLLFLVVEDLLEEFQTGYSNILIAKLGRKKYLQGHMKKTVIFSVGIIMIGMLLNLLLVHILFAGAQTSPYEDIEKEVGFLKFCFENPFVANIIFTIIIVVCGGMISVVGLMIAFTTRQRKYTYGITMLLWMTPILAKKSLVLAFQPFSEYSLDTIIPILLKVIITYLIIVLVLYGKEVYNEEV